MSVNLRDFFRACNPAKTLNCKHEQDRKYYIDFSKLRGAEIAEELAKTITWTDGPTCQLFSGHIGCGKSTELLRLKASLEEEGFHVVYFESSQSLAMGDIDVSDILLATAHQVSTSLKNAGISLRGGYFRNLLQECVTFLNTPIDISVETEVSLWGLGTLTAKAKDSPSLRNQLRQYLEPQTESLIAGLNQEILQPATDILCKQGKAGLAIIIDNLDRIDDRRLDSGKTLPEYLFIGRGEQLGQLDCHVVYTIPLSLMFSNEQQALKNRLGNGSSPLVLPMIPVYRRNGAGLAQLRQLVLSRAFPDLAPETREASVTELFDSSETLDRLCQMSGGHVRNLLGFTVSCLRKTKQLPIQRDSVERTIREARDELLVSVTEDEWALLEKVTQTNAVTGEDEYHSLLRSLFVFEYRTDDNGRWFDVNPLLTEVPKLQ
ncbi:ATP-binding protein [Leptothoe spongobia]|uniref:ATP-binding protein n=1 Tax=Leptothoe spongobia TAU-MAC 1115 TaxID=1967444 RepID=A0A947DDZ2_9CYAN|nr:ATP-binding protein [Leptothoe spongobia]MBT9315110.1 ATP-binding protein [Leptothoe spongobia TAU-MAC 1115]